MGEAICNKCGASFPEEANFCPGCGAKKGATIQHVAQSAYGIFGMLSSKNLIIAGVCLGILFAWIGGIIFTFGTTSQDAIKAAMVLANMGFAALSLFLLGGGIFNKEIDKYVRVGMVVMVAYTAVATLNMMNLLVSMFSQLSRYSSFLG